jgi:glutathionylspermidine synthase
MARAIFLALFPPPQAHQFPMERQPQNVDHTTAETTSGFAVVVAGLKAMMAYTLNREPAALARMTNIAVDAAALGMDVAALDMEVARVANLNSGSAEQNFAGTYREWRRSYYDRFPAFWGTLPGEQHEEYAVYGALEVSHEHAEALRTASARLYRLMTRLARLLQQTDSQSLLDIGIPPAAIPYLRIHMPEMPAVMCGRYEFVMTAGGPKLLEFNAETPTFVVELFHMNGQVCTDFGLADPNRHAPAQLAQAIQTAINAGLSWVQPDHPASVVFSAYADRKEERGTAEFYRSLLRENLPYRASFCGLNDLRVTDDNVLTASGEHVDVLYKLYPTEHLIEDEAPDGSPIGLALLDLVRRRRLAIINPPISFLLQNKALMALLWAMHLVQSELFTDEEHAWIEQYILPTYLSAYDAFGQPVLAERHVVKPIYGREGVSIMIRDSSEIVEQSEEHLYDEQVMIYQQYAALPTTTLQTEEGRSEVSLVHNCFVTAGIPSAIGVRASRKLIFDDNSYFLPVCSPPA